MLRSRIQKIERKLKLNPISCEDSRNTIFVDSWRAFMVYNPFIEGKRKGEKKLVWTKSMYDFIKNYYNDD